MVSKVIKKLASNRIIDHLGNCGLFSNFQYNCRSSQSTADLLTVVYDMIIRAFNRFRATRAVTLGISKALDRVWHAGLLHKLEFCGISGHIIGLVSSFLSNRLLQVVLCGKSLWENRVNTEVPQGSILGPTLFLLYTNDLPDVVCNIAIYADDAALYSGIWSVVTTRIGLWTWISSTRYCDWGRKWLVDFSAGKTQLISFEWFNNTGAIDVKNDGVDWGWLSLLNWIEALTLTLLLKLVPRKLEPWSVLWSFFLLLVKIVFFFEVALYL